MLLFISLRTNQYSIICSLQRKILAQSVLARAGFLPIRGRLAMSMSSGISTGDMLYAFIKSLIASAYGQPEKKKGVEKLLDI
jgi:hypothetical protein